MTFLDLCAGIGGISLGLERAGMKCLGQVEIDRFCRKVLDYHWPNVPKWSDIRGHNIYPLVDLVCGGYPCQPFSNAGKRLGGKDERHLWPYVYDAVRKARSPWCIFENVNGHISLGYDRVADDLEKEGYEVGAYSIPAFVVGSPQKRYRLFIVAYSDSMRKLQQKGGKQDKRGWIDNGNKETQRKVWNTGKWDTKPSVDKLVDGISGGMAKNRALANAVVPDVIEVIGRAIMEADK